MSAPKCGNCNWFVTDPSSTEGLCIFNAPQAYNYADGNNGPSRVRALWPRVLYFNLCGQWATIVST